MIQYLGMLIGESSKRTNPLLVILVLKDMYNGAVTSVITIRVTSVKTIRVDTNAFPITVGLYQNSSLGAYLFLFSHG